MVEVLSQDEIEALLAAMDGNAREESPAGADAPAAALAPAATTARPDEAAPGAKGRARGLAASRARSRPPLEYQAYDFRRPDKFSKDQMRTLQMLHETFGRMYASSLGAYLRANVQLELLSVEQIPYDEFVRSLAGNPLIAIFSMPPLAGQALLEADLNIVFSMIDRLLGGPGQAVARRADLTEIETTLATQIIRRALRELKNAWESITPIEPHLDGLETSAQFVQIVPPNDTVVLLLFQVKVGDVLGTVTLCLPYVALKPIASKLSAQRWFASTGKKADDPKHVQQLSGLIQNAKVACVARLGTAKITVEDLLRLAPGDTIVTGTPYGSEIDILVGKNVKFRGQAGTRRRKMVVRIQSVVEPNSEGEDPLAPWR
jgi:flagellar motor switch protein FliM